MDGLRDLPDNSVQMVITSPPYWGLRDYGVEGQIGLEATPQDYVNIMSKVFKEVHRVLREDETLFLNLGDCYTPQTSHKGGTPYDRFKGEKNWGERSRAREPLKSWGKHKDLVGIPWRVAFRLQEDGWYLRQDIIWAKPNPMRNPARDRFVASHEHIFLLAKRERYFFDIEAVKIPASTKTRPFEHYTGKARKDYQGTGAQNPSDVKRRILASYKKQDATGNPTYTGFNRRYQPKPMAMRPDVWRIPTQACPEGHFATFPEELVRICILAGTSPKGACPLCGSPWQRVLEPSEEYEQFLGKSWHDHSNDLDQGMSQEKDCRQVCADYITTGWKPTCTCSPQEETVPCTVLDPFGGSGTVAKVARELGRSSVLIEINPEYVEIAKKRLRAREQLFPDAIEVVT